MVPIFLPVTCSPNRFGYFLSYLEIYSRTMSLACITCSTSAPHNSLTFTPQCTELYALTVNPTIISLHSFESNKAQQMTVNRVSSVLVTHNCWCTISVVCVCVHAVWIAEMRMCALKLYCRVGEVFMISNFWLLCKPFKQIQTGWPDFNLRGEWV